ncbi:hypothetical protein AVENP_2121 [Arcobacter venerupis]|uniref:Uncharacterized protein n=1 Tax=Arcobacter venerupis TaxID=1054033 RepID=A0AAE7B977_9BACT|nr:hypothetical protein [Arcobacter venerupis]QKF67649.1 hypothetical protein AVENP_2121 [Arcobacter venerupis]RWS49192.1 hypothetical protein CKA56_10670 [Arcobacter venerupis]
MRKINIKDLELNIDITYILNLYASKTPIIIDVDGNIFTKEEEVKKKAVIYRNHEVKQLSSMLDAKAIASHLFADYKVNIIGTICKIKPVSNWQNIIDMNKTTMLYFDHQSDGVEIFEDKELEDYGWNASALEINYREISEFIEKSCDGVLLCYDNEIQFSGFVIVNDLSDVKQKVKEYIINKAKQNIKEQLIDIENDDVIDALEFFGIKA